MIILFFAFWLILNSRVTLDVVIVGALVTLVVSLFTYKLMGVSLSAEMKVWKKLPSIIGYLAVLVVEVIKANIHMIALILFRPVQEIKPQIVYFKSPVRSTAAKVALANSITLTPGTITIKLDDDSFGIHAIDAPLGDGIEGDGFVFTKKLKKIEGGH